MQVRSGRIHPQLHPQGLASAAGLLQLGAKIGLANDFRGTFLQIGQLLVDGRKSCHGNSHYKEGNSEWDGKGSGPTLIGSCGLVQPALSSFARPDSRGGCPYVVRCSLRPLTSQFPPSTTLMASVYAICSCSRIRAAQLCSSSLSCT